jgi:hypothetical protein
MPQPLPLQQVIPMYALGNSLYNLQINRQTDFIINGSLQAGCLQVFGATKSTFNKLQHTRKLIQYDLLATNY